MQTLTIGMATFRDTDGCYMTLEVLNAFHPRVQYLVIDNAPEPDIDTMNVCHAIGGRYLHRPDLHGTSAPRDAIFRLAKTDWAMCVDSHVILESGAVQALLDYIDQNPDSNDLIQGPMVHDDGKVTSTYWRATHPPGLWGVWDTTWFDAFGNPVRLIPSENNKGILLFSDGKTTAITGWDNRAKTAKDYGCTNYYETKPTKPFEIPMQGLGLFAMRCKAWPGFHPLFRGFGGEEGYIHEKVRQQGGKCYCLPALRWRHKFRNMERPHGGKPTPYRLDKSDHVWNLLIGHRELGIEVTETIKSNFGGGVAPSILDQLVDSANKVQPFGKILPRKRLKLLGVWYTNNAAPLPLLQKSLQTIKRAADETMFHDVQVVTSTWQLIANNPFPCTVWKPDVSGHSAIIAQIRRALSTGEFGALRDKDYDYDGVVFLEHDVLYPPNYFDRMGTALSHGGPVASNLDYEGLNATGWLKVKELHEPMHQLAMRRDVALANLDRAEKDCKEQGWALLEPDSTSTLPRTFPHFAEVEPKLWIGQQVTEPPQGVNAVLNLCEIPDIYQNNFDRIECQQQVISDGHKEPAPSLDWLKRQVQWVTERIHQGKSVYIHCLGGVSRCGLVTAAYLMTSHGVGREQALAIIRKARPQVTPRPAFWQLLSDYEKTIILRPASLTKGDRSDWVRIGFIGLVPSIHVNW